MRLVMSVLVVALLLVGSTLTIEAATVKDDGLILYFSFDSAKGGTIEDETGGGNDGDIVKGAKLPPMKLSTAKARSYSRQPLTV